MFLQFCMWIYSVLHAVKSSKCHSICNCSYLRKEQSLLIIFLKVMIIVDSYLYWCWGTVFSVHFDGNRILENGYLINSKMIKIRLLAVRLVLSKPSYTQLYESKIIDLSWQSSLCPLLCNRINLTFYIRFCFIR